MGVSFDRPTDSAKFAEKFGFPFPLIPDTDRKIGLTYGACDSPNDEYARRIAYVIDENGRIAQVYPKVDARTLPKTLLESLHVSS